ncbi:MAG TPA: cytochrome c peroxidase [Steroidobacteraceae bacterium]|nr:cytochrome c peroxidase [Steroidobacteraceae bacterium]
MIGRRAGLSCTLVLACLPSLGLGAIPGSSSSLLPLGTDLGDEAFDRPREVFRSETAGGHKSYMVVLGDVAFSSPKLLGGAARQAGISCGTCHVNGAANSLFYIPGLSTRHGNFDTTSRVFNPKTDDSVLDPLTIPSLRGAHLLAPYGHDGRTLSLRDFIRNVVVNEFAGPEPSAEVLDALVIYVQDIDFVPNPRLGAGGKLVGAITREEKHGEKLFNRPFPHDPMLSCAGCHQPAEAFVDHRQHDVGSGGLFKTPTLRNANFNAPYFHDGRYASYTEVIAHFNQAFTLGLSGRDQADLGAYLKAVGDGDRATTPDDVPTRVKECTDFATALDTALPQHDAAAATLVVDTLDRELRELTEKFPEPKDTTVSGGLEQRAKARAALKGLVLSLREISLAVQEGRFDEATAGLNDYRQRMTSTVAAMEAAREWSLFDRPLHDTHYAAVRKLYEVGTAGAN